MTNELTIPDKMKEIKLNRLVLRNFKGMTFDLQTNSEDTDIYGANATGKTTIADAFAWLLFDKDSLGRADFEIKALDSDGQEQHNLEHSVEGVFELGMKTTVTLRKVYHEVWQRKRGSAQSTLTGHAVEYFVNGVPVQKKDFVAQVADIAGEESIFRLLTSPTAFPALHWQKQRSLLLEVCGDINDADVIESNPELSTLPAIVGKRSLEDHKKIMTARRTEINKELEKIPVRIDEVKRGLPDLTGLNRKQILDDIKDNEEQLNASKLALQGIDTGGPIAELSRKLSIIYSEIHKIENEHVNKQSIERNKLRHELEKIDAIIRGEQRRFGETVEEVKRREKLRSGFEPRLQLLRSQWADVDARQFEDTTEQVCAACGQDLPSDRVQAAREKALAAFNNTNATQLGEIEEKGISIKKEQDLNEQHISRLLAEQISIDTHIESMKAARLPISERIESYQVTAMLPGVEPLRAQKAEIEAQIEEEKAGKAKNRESVRADISRLDLELRALKEKADRFDRAENGEKRIIELKDSEKQRAIEFERLERELYLCELFIRTKVSMLTERINSKFEMVRFKLFDIQVNGGLSECCEITVKGVPFTSGLNNAARINAGLDVCRTLSTHFGLSAPIFVDNAESVCELIDMDAQVIRLVVSPPDAVLRVEKAKKTI